MRSSLEIGFTLDRRWHWMRGEMETSKRPALLAVARALSEAGVLYAVIGGVALQIHVQEPRTTLDIDIAVARRDALPAAALLAAGLVHTGTFEHSVDWRAEDGTPIQFSDDAALHDALTRTIEITLDDVPVRVLAKTDLLHEKLRAGADAARRRSKRLQDLADAERLLEEEPRLAATLSADERRLLGR